MRILITGDNSYIGVKLEDWLGLRSGEYEVYTISMLDEQWRQADFSGFDAIVHVAAIVHQNELENMEVLYRKVNTELPVEVARKAREEGVTQFVFMSTMAVYGLDGDVRRPVVIDGDTPYAPNTLYGRSKLMAEQGLRALSGETFAVAIIRAPMIYGPNCRGNYARLRRLVLRLHMIPRIANERSQLYVTNLCECIRLILDERAHGVFFPQNQQYTGTTELSSAIAAAHGKRIWRSRLMGWGVRLVGNRISPLRKAFGNLCYDRALSAGLAERAAVVGLDESIRQTETQWQDNPPEH